MSVTSSLPSQFQHDGITLVNQGDCPVSGDERVTFSTVLGSCVSACIRDRVASVGGMNHFLLADSNGAEGPHNGSARYGAYAMEQLINTVLSRGSGRKANLEFKLFGGGKITSALDEVGAKNIAFVRAFLAQEGYVATSEDLGGNYARRVLFQPHCGRAFVKRLSSAVKETVARDEMLLVGRRTSAPLRGGDVELF